MISELLMRSGDWDLQLVRESPSAVRQAVRFGSVIYIVPSHISGTDAATVRATAAYAGLVTRRQVTGGSYGGPGLAGFLSSTKGEAAHIPDWSAVLTLPFTFADFVTAVFTSGALTNGITLGADHGSTSTVVTELVAGEQAGIRSALDYVAGITGNAWRITPQGTLDYGTASTTLAPIRADDTAGLFATRSILITPDHAAGQSGSWHFYTPQGWDPGADIDDLRDHANVDGTTATAGGSPVGFLRLDGGAAAQFWNGDKIDPPTTNAGDIDNVAQAAADLYSTASYRLPCKIDLHRPASEIVAPGDSVWMFDLLEGLVGWEHVEIPGLSLAPLPIEVTGTQWPIQRGFGVFACSPFDRDDIVDLTPFVEWETGPTTLTLGSLPRSATPRNLFE